MFRAAGTGIKPATAPTVLGRKKMHFFGKSPIIGSKPARFFDKTSIRPVEAHASPRPDLPGKQYEDSNKEMCARLLRRSFSQPVHVGDINLPVVLDHDDPVLAQFRQLPAHGFDRQPEEVGNVGARQRQFETDRI